MVSFIPDNHSMVSTDFSLLIHFWQKRGGGSRAEAARKKERLQRTIGQNRKDNPGTLPETNVSAKKN